VGEGKIAPAGNRSVGEVNVRERNSLYVDPSLDEARNPAIAVQGLERRRKFRSMTDGEFQPGSGGAWPILNQNGQKTPLYDAEDQHRGQHEKARNVSATE
jgi:hypothetical protein